MPENHPVPPGWNRTYLIEQAGSLWAVVQDGPGWESAPPPPVTQREAQLRGQALHFRPGA